MANEIIWTDGKISRNWCPTQGFTGYTRRGVPIGYVVPHYEQIKVAWDLYGSNYANGKLLGHRWHLEWLPDEDWQPNNWTIVEGANCWWKAQNDCEDAYRAVCAKHGWLDETFYPRYLEE